MTEILLTLSGLYVLLFLLSLWLEDNSIADVFWGAGFIVIATISLLMLDNPTGSQLILTMLVALWGMRLLLYIGRRKYEHPGEDARYAKWRKQWTYFRVRSFFQVYMLQGVLMCTVATPIFIVNLSASPELNIYITFVGALIAVAGLYYENRADTELAVFMKIKKPGEILTTGLRKYSRYPQYFGESVFWLGICLMAAQISIFAFVGWGVITFLVRYVSGAAMLEERYRYNDAYQKYSKNTPIFIPDFRK